MAKDRRIEELEQVELFGACTRKELEAIARLADEIEVPAGDVLIEEGKVGREFFVVAEGTATVTSGGRRLGTVGPGSFVGEMALIEPKPRTATVVAETPMRLYVFSVQGFLTLLEDAPPVTRRILKGVAQRLRTSEQALTG